MAKDRKPNFLWISFEDTNPRYGCYGDPVARTPTLDRLAAEGCCWTRCFSTAGVCAPARSAIITGMYAISIGTHHMRTTHANRATPEMPTPYSAVVPHYVKCFTEYLRAAGYYCSNNAKTDYQFTPPLTAWDALGPHAHWRDRPDPDQPFFAVFNPTRTHESGMWPEKCPEPEFDPDAIPLPPYFPDTPVVRQAMARMYTHIARSDQELAQLLQQLDEDGLSENTYIFHWSDHGPLPRGKRWPYDAGIHVPLIARGPGIEAGQVCGDLVSTVDLGPTMLSLAGLMCPPTCRAARFWAAKPNRRESTSTRAATGTTRRTTWCEPCATAALSTSATTGQTSPTWRGFPIAIGTPLCRRCGACTWPTSWTRPQSAMFRYPRPVEELYDTEADPHEIDNLAANPQYQPERDRLRGALDEWLEEVGDMGRMAESEMVRQWYPDGQQPQTAPPVCVPICADSLGTEPALEGGTFRGPLLVQLHCATQGASMAYAVDDDPHWHLYTEPLRMEVGTTTLRAKAIRIGYEESQETRATFVVE